MWQLDVRRVQARLDVLDADPMEVTRFRDAVDSGTAVLLAKAEAWRTAVEDVPAHGTKKTVPAVAALEVVDDKGMSGGFGVVFPAEWRPSEADAKRLRLPLHKGGDGVSRAEPQLVAVKVCAPLATASTTRSRERAIDELLRPPVQPH